MPVVAITLTVASACAINVGKAFQKKAAKTLPKLTLTTTRAYLTHDVWIRGLMLDILGGGGILLALWLAPMSVVQPASASGVAILAAISHVYLGERLAPREWVAVASCGCGVGALGWYSRSGSPDAPPIGSFRLLVAFALGVVCLLAPSVASRRFASIMSRDAARLALIKIGAQCGTCFALSSFCVKMAIAYARAWMLFTAPLAMAASLSLTSVGLYYQTKGFRDGNSIVVVCVAGNVAQMIVAAMYGLVILGEPLPETWRALFGWMCSWSLILFGVVALSGADSGSALAGTRESRGPSILPTTTQSKNIVSITPAQAVRGKMQ